MVTVSLNYDTITFSSIYLIPADMNSLLVKFSKNCGTVGSNINLNSLISTISDEGVLTIPVATLIPSATVFPDSVYKFTFTIGTDSGSTPNGNVIENVPGTYTVSFCIFIGSVTRCKALANYLETENELIPLLVKALTNVDECDNCDCTTMCTIYDYLIDLLDSSTSTTTTNVYNNCGCS